MKRALVSCAMRDAEGDWNESARISKKSKMAAGDVELDEVDNLQFILSLEEDVSDELLQSVCVKEAEMIEVKEVLSVLERLSLSCEEAESRLASEILSKLDSDSDSDGAAVDDNLKNFVRDLNDVVRNCYKSADKVKNQQLKMVSLKKEFRRYRFDKKSKLFGSWQHFVGMLASAKKQSDVIFQHVVQHIWSYAVLRSPDSTSVISVSDTVSTEKRKVVDEVERVAIRQHAGWAIKRARDTIVSSPSSLSIKISSSNSEEIEVSKEYLMRLIKRLGKDELQEPGKFMFIPFPETDDFFIALHKEAESLLKQESVLKQTEKNAVIWSLQQLSTSITLRSKWENLLGKATGYAKAGHVILLQRIVSMFLKSKQQIIREQLQLKPQKSSQSLRQSLAKSSDNTSSSKVRSEGNGKALKVSAVPEIVKELRKNTKNPETVQQFLANVKKGNVNSTLQFLTGKELVRILKSLDLPSFSGKGKVKQIDILENFLLSVEDVTIKYPDKVCYLYHSEFAISIFFLIWHILAFPPGYN